MEEGQRTRAYVIRIAGWESLRDATAHLRGFLETASANGKDLEIEVWFAPKKGLAEAMAENWRKE